MGFIEGNGTTTEINNYSFIDDLFENNSQKLFYRLKQIDLNGSFEYYQVIEVEVGTPSEFSLSQNYPNPFNSETIIEYQLQENSFVSLKVFDVLGNEFELLVNEYKSVGKYKLRLNLKNQASGIYFYKLTIGGNNQVKKMILLR